jgi:adenylate kinase
MVDVTDVIVLTGTPGVGKTSISKILSDILDVRLIDVNQVVKEENLVLDYDRNRDSDIVDITRLSKKIIELIQIVDEDVIIEGHYASEIVPKKYVSNVIILRRDPNDLEKKLRDKGFNEKKIRENVLAEILDVCLIDAINRYSLEKLIEVDTTDKDVEETVNEILGRLKEGNGKIGKIDWLKKIESEGRFKDYLSY